VTVCGLNGAAQHNGKTGVVGEDGEGAGRCTVELSTGEVIRIKAQNLTELLPPPADVDGAQAAAAPPAGSLEDGYGSDASFKSYDSRQDDRPWH
jgi:hypothetical protein